MAEPTVDVVTPVPTDDVTNDPNVSQEKVLNVEPLPTDVERPGGEEAVQAAEVKEMNPLDQQIQAKLKAPDLYKDKGYMKNLVDVNGEVEADRLFKEIDELQGLKGKKSIAFNYAEASPEDIQTHIESKRPESVDAYKIEGLAPEATTAIQNMFYEKGIDPYEANELVEGYKAIEQAQVSKLMTKEGFIEELSTSFGENHEKVAPVVANAMKEVQSAEDQKKMGLMTNSQLGVVYRLVNSLIEGYGIEEKALKNVSGTGNIDSVVDAEKERDEAFKAVHALKKTQYTAAQHKQAVARYQSAQSKLTKLQGGK